MDGVWGMVYVSFDLESSTNFTLGYFELRRVAKGQGVIDGIVPAGAPN